MKLFQDRPIKTKLIAIAMLVSACALVTASASFLTYDWISARRGAIARVGTLAEVVAANSTAALAFDNREDATATLALLEAEPHVTTACLYRTDGSRLAGYARGGGALTCPIRTVVEKRASLVGDRITYLNPVRMMGAETVGVVWVQADTLNVRERFRTTAIIGLIVMLLCAGVAVFLASRLQSVISTPILTLVAASRRVSFEKNYSIRAERTGDDELGMLIDAFNEMLEQIQVRDQQLEDHRDHLDVEVRKRTREMELAIQELEAEIDQRQRAEERIRYLAYYDVLTGLPNRRLLEERLTGAIARRHEGEERPLALLFLDLDRFKEINDTYGHATGDQLLEQVAERLVRCVRESDHVSRWEDEDEPDATVSRQGGDEFTILLTSITRGHDASRVARRILEELQEPFPLPDRDVVIGASIGIAIHPDDGEDAESLIKHADTAMYHAKENGRNDFEYFTEDMKIAALARLGLETDLRRAVSNGEMTLHYQPQIDLVTGEICRLEALLRWHQPARGLVPPADFVAVAEECGLIMGLGEWVLREACAQMALWIADGLPPMRVGVNVSGHQFRKNALDEAVLAALDEASLPPHLLELEVTESSMIGNEDEAIESLSRLRAHGISISLDDFGTGYSSLSYLQRLPLDSLKIDRSFVHHLDESEQDYSIVAATLTMAHGLGLEVVAEGIENETQLAILKSWGCDYGQGFHFSHPLPAEEIPLLLARWNDYED